MHISACICSVVNAGHVHIISALFGEIIRSRTRPENPLGRPLELCRIKRQRAILLRHGLIIDSATGRETDEMGREMTARDATGKEAVIGPNGRACGIALCDVTEASARAIHRQRRQHGKY